MAIRQIADVAPRLSWRNQSRRAQMFSEISSKTLKMFFEQSPIPLTLASPVFDDCPIILCNEPFLKLTDYGRDDVIGRNCRLLQGRNTDAKARASLRHAIEDRREALVPITNYRKDGSEFENYVFILPIFDSNANLLYILGSQCDITASLRQMTPLEHAQLLAEGIELTNPKLVAREHLKIAAGKPLPDTMRTVLTGEMFE